MKLKLLLSMLVTVSFLFGQYRTFHLGVEQASLGYAPTSTSNASALFFNPAAGAYVDGQFVISLGGTFLKTEFEYLNPATGGRFKSDNDLGTPINASILYNPKGDFEKWSLGLNVTTPYASKFNWPKGWDGSAISISANLSTLNIQPSVSFSPTKWISIGYGLIFVIPTLEVVQESVPAGILTLTGEDFDQDQIGRHIGVYIKPMEGLDFSFAYKSRIDITADGTAVIPNTLNDTFSSGLPLPSEYNVGVAATIDPKWKLHGGITLINWSEYTERKIDFSTSTVIVPKDLRNVVTHRMGVEHLASDKLTLRFGYYHSPSPVNESLWEAGSPSFTSTMFAAGGTVHLSDRFSVDGVLQYFKLDNRKIESAIGPNGEYKANAYGAGIGLNYKIK